LEWLRGFPVEVGLFIDRREVRGFEIAFLIAGFYGSFLETELGGWSVARTTRGGI